MEEKKNFSNRDDLRTLFIAFLTTLIMLAFYHIGMTVCNMKRECARPQCIVVKSEPCPMKRFNRCGAAPGQFQRRHHMNGQNFRKDAGKFNKPAPVKAPVKPAPAAETPAQK